MDTLQWAAKAAALCIAVCIPLSVVGVVIMAVTHDGSTIQLAFDYFGSIVTWGIPTLGAILGLHIVAPNLPLATPAAPLAPAPAADPNLDGTAGANV